MISIKNPHQIQKMREAGAVLHEVLTQVRAKIEPGITTKELDLSLIHIFRQGLAGVLGIRRQAGPRPV